MTSRKHNKPPTFNPRRNLQKPNFQNNRNPPNKILSEYQNFENDEEIDSDEASGDEIDENLDEEKAENEENEGQSNGGEELKGLGWVQDSDGEEDEEEDEEEDIPKIPKIPNLLSKLKSNKRSKVDDDEEEEEDLDLSLDDEDEDEQDEDEDEEEHQKDESQTNDDGVHRMMLRDIRSTLQGKKKSGRIVEVEDEFQEESQYNLPPIKRKRVESQQSRKKSKEDEKTTTSQTQESDDTTLTIKGLLSSLHGPDHSMLKKQLISLATSKTEQVEVPDERVRVERALRKRAYADTTQQVTDWVPALEAQDRAQHARFPLKENQPDIPAPTTDSLVVTFRASNEMESEIENILKRANLQQSKEELDDLPPSATNPQAIARQRAELIRMRNMVAYQQLKISRQNKIKSKKYRKIKKRERDGKEMENIENDPALQEEEEERNARTRILERMTLRHKNKTRKAQSAMRASHRF